MKEIKEGKAVIETYEADVVSSDMPVFYNEVMKVNRDISVAVLDAMEKKDMMVADPLAGSGVRAIRFLKELKKSTIKKLMINDYSDEAIALIEKNLERNGLSDDSRVRLKKHEANIFIMKTKGFHYIDIDPFGTPNPFLDSAMKKIGREGIIAVTATDTAPLAGTFPKACRRKYWAEPKLDELMHETGLRILIRKVQLVAAQYDKALVPVIAYASDHYMRIFFRCKKGKKHVDELLKMHGMFDDRGPLWLGKLWDGEFLKKTIEYSEGEAEKFLNVLLEESKIDQLGFYHLHALCKKHKLKLKKTQDIKDEIVKMGYSVADTHFTPYGIRSDIPLEKFLSLFSTH